MLHGGRSHGQEPTSWRQLSVVRARLVGASLVRSTRRQQGGIAFLRYAVRGWNGDGAPVRDGRWALHQIRQVAPGSTIGLVGYSMGGRAALQLVDEPGVQALVTLAAWVERADLATMTPVPGLRALLLHGSLDRVTDPAGSALAAEVLRARGAEVSLGPTLVLARHDAAREQLALPDRGPPRSRISGAGSSPRGGP